jgi:hypothetical protein
MKKHLITILALTGLVTSSFAQIPSYVPTNGMIGWWPFDGNANDLSPNGNDGTVHGAVLSVDRFGTPNMAYSFDGIDDYIDCNRTYQSTFSFSIWFKTFASQSYSPIVDAFDGHWEIQLKNNQPDYVSFMTTTIYQEFISTTTVENNVWYHLVCTYNAGNVNFYINGQPTDQFIVLPLQVFNGTYNFGASLSGTDQYLNGTLDDIGLWDRELTDEEVTSLYIGETCTATITTAGPSFFCQGESVQLTASEGDSYLWNNGATTQVITVNEADNYTVTVTSNGCQATSEAFAITVNPLPAVSLASISPICLNRPSFELQGGAPAGGSYTVNGTSGTTFNPTQLGVGQHTVTYSYTDGNNCSASASRQVTINGVPSVSFTGLASGYLPTDQPVQLAGSPAGGVFNGPGVSGTSFSPETAGIGTHGISYAVVNANGCIGVHALCTTVDIAGGGIGLDNGGSSIQAFPNPSSGLFTLIMDGIEGMVQLSVLDIRGREIISQSVNAAGRTTYYLDLSGYATGIYTLRTQSVLGSGTLKLVRE